MKNYSWAVNKDKLARAYAKAKVKTEKAIKAEYVKLAGLVREPKMEDQKPMEEVAEEATEATEEVEEVAEEATEEATETVSEDDAAAV